RRYFWKALESDRERSRHALALIGELFRIEREIAQAAPEEKLEARRAKTKPIVDAFFSWCDAQAPLVLDETPISRGSGSARQQDAQQRLAANIFRPVTFGVGEEHRHEK